jgi:hypothetical protein
MGLKTTFGSFLAELWDFKTQTAFYSFIPPPLTPSPCPSDNRIRENYEGLSYIHLSHSGGEGGGGGDYVEGPSGHTQTYPLCTAQAALENMDTVFLILHLQRLSLGSHSCGIHSELHRLTLRFEMNLLAHLHHAFKGTVAWDGFLA